MKLANLILAHSKPAQLQRLVESIAHKDCFTFIHLDAKCDISDYDFLLTMTSIKLIEKRNNVKWGGFSQVITIISCFKEILKHKDKFDYVNVISGQDYPITPVSQFLSFLENHPGKIFMEFHLPGHKWTNESMSRLTRYHLTDYPFRGSNTVEKVLNLILPERRLPVDFEIIGHSTWYTFDLESCNYVVDFFSENSSFISNFKFTWGADEILIQSILYNSALSYKMENNNLRYIDWSEKKASPKILTMKDKDILINSKCFFARKFDMQVDEEILNYLDQIIREK